MARPQQTIRYVTTADGVRLAWAAQLPGPFALLGISQGACAAEVFARLTDRERDVLAKLASGLTNAQIGDALFISEKTVRNQLTHIFEKLNVSNRSQAIVFAHQNGFGD